MKAKYISEAIKESVWGFSGCLSKKRYKSEKGARMAVENHPEKAGHRYYKCDGCQEWHTTSAPKR